VCEGVGLERAFVLDAKRSSTFIRKFCLTIHPSVRSVGARPRC
jgi:hypothetical protein